MKYYKYKNRNSIILVTNENIEVHIPFDQQNRHYQEYLEWIEKGNMVEEITFGEEV
jgi:hypothetical protein